MSACRISADVLLMLSLFVISPHFLNTLPPIGCIGEKLVHLRTRKKRKARKKHSRRLPTVLKLSDVCEYSLLFFPEGEEALADVVEHHEQAHTAEHCDVFLDRGGKARQHPPEQGLCDAVSGKIAHGDIENEAQNNAEVALLILKGEVFIQKVAEYAAEKVVRGRGDPIAQMKNIVKHEHDRRAENGVYHSDDNKTKERFIKKL